MDILSGVIIIANILSVYLAAKNNWWTWPTGIIAGVATGIMFYNDIMWESFIMNTYSVITCICGCFIWNTNTDDNDRTLIATHKYLFISIFIILSCVLYVINSHILHSTYSLCDSFATGAFAVATWMLAIKNIYSWPFWILGDFLYIITGIQNNDWKYTIIYGVMLLLAVYGCIENYKKYKNLQ